MICPITDKPCRTNGCGEKCYKRDSLGYSTAPQHDAKLLVICRALFNLGNQFKPEWVRRKGFWRLLWFALLAKFGIVTTNKYSDNGCYFSIGTATPLPKLWDAGYKCSYAGKVLGEVVLFYE